MSDLPHRPGTDAEAGGELSTSTLTVVPEATASGTAPCAEPPDLNLSLFARSPHVQVQALARAARPDFEQWLHHVKPAAGCARPIRLAGSVHTVEADTGRVLSTFDTGTLPDGIIYKPCGNRRASACPSCSKRYQRDAYHVIRSGLVGGKGVPETVATHPAVFPTFTAPSFGPVHTRVVRRHTCTDRRRCDCRPEPCHARRDAIACMHGQPAACFARHEDSDRRLGTPICLDCYDHDAQVVWNLSAGELWRRTRITIERHLQHTARLLGIDADRIRVQYGKAAELQRRGVAHFHAIIRLDGKDPDDPGVVLPPPAGLTALDLVAAVEHAARTTAFTTDPHPAKPDGWRIGWGEQVDVRVITIGADGEVTDSMVAGYLAKYATKSTEVTGHTMRRLSDEDINVYADPDGTHVERLVDACWRLGTPREWRGLRRWAHMLGFGGHFLTKSRGYSITFKFIRDQRIAYQRAVSSGPERDARETPTTLVVNFLRFVGAGWHTTGDAMLANTSAALAREYNDLARTELAAIAAERFTVKPGLTAGLAA
jgi:hypothetical protein